jgi:hypothetical protein
MIFDQYLREDINDEQFYRICRHLSDDLVYELFGELWFHNCFSSRNNLRTISGYRTKGGGSGKRE